jgi:voltage-gated potassium channel
MPGPTAPQSFSQARTTFLERLRTGDTYGILLGLILATYVTMAALDHGLWSRFVVSAMLGGVLLLALHTSHVRGRWFRIAAAMVFVVALATFVQAALDRHGKDGTTFLMFLLVLAAPVVILGRILRHRVISTETILGAICVYVLLGLAFSGIYAGMNDIEHGHFFVQHASDNNVDFLYFSFVVLTTLGFGDLSPGPNMARVIVTFEALIGQIFLVTLVARLMSLYGLERRRPIDVALDLDHDGVPDTRVHLEIEEDDDDSDLEE